MASRFWVGGTGTWDTSTTTNWSASTGGAGGASAPTTTDDAFFNASSGGGIVTMLGTAACQNFDSTAFTGSFISTGSGNPVINGNITLGVAFDFGAAPNSSTVTINITANCTITSNGFSMYRILINGTGITVQLADALSTIYLVTLTQGTFTTNDKTLNIYGYVTTGTPTTNLGASIITLRTWSMSTTGIVNAGTSSITIAVAPVSGNNIFSGGNKIYNNLYIFSGTTLCTVGGNNTFNELRIEPGKLIRFSEGFTYTVTTFTLNGTANSPITLESGSAGTAWNLSKSTGTVTAFYTSIKDSAASGGATFNATHSTNVSGNTGWTFLNSHNSGPIPLHFNS